MKKILDFFVKVEPDTDSPTLSEEELMKILARDEAKDAPAPGKPVAPSGAKPVAPAARRAPSPDAAPTPRPRVAEVAAPAVAKVSPPSPNAPPPADMPDFETIYRAAKVPLPQHGYTIDKVAAMLANPRLAGMSESVKANSVLMALEVAGVPINEVVADAVARDHAIDDFEAWWAAKVAQTEAEKRAENASIEEEMNHYLEARRERIRANNAAVQQSQASFLAWLDLKRVEERRLSDAVQPFVTENPITLNTGAIAPARADAPDFNRAPGAPRPPR